MLARVMSSFTAENTPPPPPYHVQLCTPVISALGKLGRSVHSCPAWVRQGDLIFFKKANILLSLLNYSALVLYVSVKKRRAGEMAALLFRRPHSHL